MSEQTPNTECKVCGEMYYSCRTCGEVNHWKAVACSPEHYVQYVEQVYAERNKKEVINDVVVEATDKNVEDKVVNKKTARTKISENAG